MTDRMLSARLVRVVERGGTPPNARLAISHGDPGRRRADGEARTFCVTLAYGGCRLSEALALTVDRVDLAGGLLLFESLKKRRLGIHRAVPVPPSLLDALDLVVHGIRKRGRRGKGEVGLSPDANQQTRFSVARSGEEFIRRLHGATGVKPSLRRSLREA